MVFTARLGSGALASFEATRFAAGRKNGLRIELNGGRGSLAFDLERLNELEFFDRATDAADRRASAAILVTEAEPSLPVRLVAARARARLGAHVHAPGPGPADGDRGGHQPRRRSHDGLPVQRVLDAVARSAAQRVEPWTPVLTS